MPKKYSDQQMADALLSSKNGMPVATASKKFGVPRITLRNKLKGISPEVCTMGPTTVLTQEEEERILTWIVDIARAGFPVTKQSLIDTVAKLVKELNRKNPFCNGIPGKKWFTSFLKRHPNITLRTPEKLSGYRGKLTEGDIRNWFQDVLNYFTENSYLDVLKNGDRIFNSDETAISLCPKTGRVLAPKGAKNIYDVSKTSEKENLTVLLTVSATGNIAPPMLVYPYKRIPSDIATNFPKGWGLGKSTTGWMTGEVFFEYMANIFEPWLTENNVERPVVFFVDGHKSHLTLHLSLFLKEKQIILVALYPNATHILQPLDVAVFYPLKCKWKSHVRKWLLENENRPLMRHTVAALLEKVISNSVSPSIIQNGFRVCGLFPFDPNSVDYTKIIKKVNAHDKGNSQDNLKESHTNMTQANTNDIQTCITILETNIPKNILTMLKEQNLEEDWNGPESTRDLYFVWKNIQSQIASCQSLNVTNLVTNEDNTVEIANDHEEYEAEEGNACTKMVDDLEQESEIQCEEQQTPEPLPSTSFNTSSLYFEVESRENQDKEVVVELNTTDKESPFKKYLFWPKEEIKTQKGEKEKSRSVITSDYWVHQQQKKEQFKLEKEQLKENRKRTREEKQKEKIAKSKQPQNKMKKTGAKENHAVLKKLELERMEWICYKCKTVYKNQHYFEKKSKWLKCLSCSNTVHKICVFKYLKSLELESDDEEDHFVCERCGVTMDISSEDENWDTDNDF